jgi:hypothetical protein
MRGLYWLTAVTLVAAAVCTVAIADYTRRHPQGLSGLWSSSSSSLQQPIPNTPLEQMKTAPAPAYPSDIASPSGSPAMSLDVPPPQIPSVTYAKPYAEPTIRPNILPPDPPVDINSVPEHQQLKEAALKGLVSMQPEVPALPSTTAKPKQPVVDEFTYSDKPLTPLYVPIDPNAKVVLPPPSIIKEVAKLPMIPGVSARNQASAAINTRPPMEIEVQRGPQIMPGLHAAAPPAQRWENPVYDTMNTVAELMSAFNPTTYLMAMPASDKRTKSTSFATDATLPVVKKAPMVKPAAPDCCPTLVQDTTCKESQPITRIIKDNTEVIVRTYSIAEFTKAAVPSLEDATLIRLITTMVAPDTWNTKDSTIEYFPQGKCLVVRHQAHVQQQVEDLLTQLKGQIQQQTKTPVISRVPGLQPASELELVPISPRECQQLPKVITIEDNRCVEGVSYVVPLTPDGRLIPVPMDTLPKSSMVPAQFETTVEGWFFDGPMSFTVPQKAPEFFPWFLPYAPLPEGPVDYEESVLKRK